MKDSSFRIYSGKHIAGLGTPYIIIAMKMASANDALVEAVSMFTGNDVLKEEIHKGKLRATSCPAQMASLQDYLFSQAKISAGFRLRMIYIEFVKNNTTCSIEPFIDNLPEIANSEDDKRHKDISMLFYRFYHSCGDKARDMMLKIQKETACDSLKECLDMAEI